MHFSWSCLQSLPHHMDCFFKAIQENLEWNRQYLGDVSHLEDKLIDRSTGSIRTEICEIGRCWLYIHLLVCLSLSVSLSRLYITYQVFLKFFIRWFHCLYCLMSISLSDITISLIILNSFFLLFFSLSFFTRTNCH